MHAEVLKQRRNEAKAQNPLNWSQWQRNARQGNVLSFQFCLEIENRLGIPIVDKTNIGLTGPYYDIHMRWQPLPNESDDSAFKRALHDQLGLNLVPSREPIEMFIVEKAK